MEAIVSMKVYEAAARRILGRQYYDVREGIVNYYKSDYPEKSVKTILNEAIRYGCGGSIYPHVDGIWYVMFYPGIKVIVDDDNLNSIRLDKKIFIATCEQLLTNERLKSKQLTLEL